MAYAFYLYEWDPSYLSQDFLLKERGGIHYYALEVHSLYLTQLPVLGRRGWKLPSSYSSEVQSKSNRISLPIKRGCKLL